jgi:hypothetical protein
MASYVANLNELTAPVFNDFVLVSDTSDSVDTDKKMQLVKLAIKNGTPTAGRLVSWTDANQVQDAGFAIADLARKPVTPAPVAGRVARWQDANTVEDGGFDTSDIGRLSTTQSYSALKTFSAGINLGQASNLDYYNQGSWTPALQFGGLAVGLTYSAQIGRYIRIGKKVTVWVSLQLSALGSSTGSATIEGLPFVTANITNHRPSAWINASLVTVTGQLMAINVQNTTTLTIQTLNNGAAAGATQANFTSSSALRFTFEYETA